MKRHRRQLVAALMLALAILAFYFAGIMQWIVAVVLLIVLFPFLSFSLFFSLIEEPREKKAVDTIRRRYTT